jgi:hypothetical protein
MLTTLRGMVGRSIRLTVFYAIIRRDGIEIGG